MVKLGIYRHWKNGHLYEVLGTSLYCSGKDLFTIVYYKDVETNTCWSRSEDDFLATVHTGEPRFTLASPLDSPHALLIETIKQNKAIWDQCKADNPAWVSSGMGKSLKYVIGDKIAFALSIRIINRAEAGRLIKEINAWS